MKLMLVPNGNHAYLLNQYGKSYLFQRLSLLRSIQFKPTVDIKKHPSYCRSPKMNAFERNQAVFAWIGLCDEPKASIYKNCLYRGFGLCFFISLIIGLLASAVYVERFVVDNLESALFGVLQICSLTAVTIPMVVTVFRRTQLMKIFNLFRQFNGNSDH